MLSIKQFLHIPFHTEKSDLKQLLQFTTPVKHN